MDFPPTRNDFLWFPCKWDRIVSGIAFRLDTAPLGLCKTIDRLAPHLRQVDISVCNQIDIMRKVLPTHSLCNYRWSPIACINCYKSEPQYHTLRRLAHTLLCMLLPDTGNACVVPFDSLKFDAHEIPKKSLSRKSFQFGITHRAPSCTWVVQCRTNCLRECSLHRPWCKNHRRDLNRLAYRSRFGRTLN